jgi:hypothetical protein
MRFGEIPGTVLSSWIVDVVEPVVAASAKGEDEAGKVFNSFYKGLLAHLGNQLAITYENEYQSAWLMLTKNPGLVQTSFTRAFNAINNALLTIRKHQPERVEDWIEHMTATIADCRTIDEFLSVGRIYAWLSGLSQFRERALSEMVTLNQELKQRVARESGNELSDITSKRWLSMKPVFVGTAGGFAGLRGSFMEPPRIALLDDQVVATDGHSTYALFTDTFGSVLLQNNTFDALMVRAKSQNDGVKKFISKFDESLVPYTDITTSIMTDNTLILSRNSSFYLYIFGWYA